MNVPDIRTQQLSLGNILSLGWSIYKKCFQNIVLTALIIVLPLCIISQIMSASKSIILILLVYILQIIFSPLLLLVIIFSAERALNEEIISFSEALHLSVKRWRSCIGTGVLQMFAIFFLFLLLVVPGIIWSVYYTFSSQVVALRNVGEKKALDYSKNLVKGQWERVFGISLITSLITSGIIFVVTLIPLLLVPNSVTIVVMNTFGTIIYAFYIIAITIFFLNVDYLKNPIPASNPDTATDLNMENVA